ncbi:MAG: hypothetical protein OD814_001831 [Candidatus Alkanophagales archaeon MCA70_species_1]|nr:hypothetical protein [Candidatus Alkanophaga volatiphilum]
MTRWDEKFKEYLRKKGFSQSTIRDYVRKSKAFKEFLGERELSETSEEDIRRFKKYLSMRGLSKETIKKYLNVARKVVEMINEEEERKEVGGKEYFRMKASRIKELIDELQKECENIETMCERCIFNVPEEELNAEDRALRVKEILYMLDKELEYFKKGTFEDREIFRKNVPAEHVGYITALIRVLYDEDKFDKWMLFSEFPRRGKR